MKYIFRSSIDVDHALWTPGRPCRVTEGWVRKRLDYFHKYTLQSMLNQTEQDFDIWVLCGICHRDITSKYNWHPRVKVIYDWAKQNISKIKDDYLTIARIDSDDLFHKDALKAMKENLVKDPNLVTTMAFRTNYKWNRRSNIIQFYHQSHPPFFVHTFPKKLYQNYLYFKKLHFGKHVGQTHNAKTLPKYYICETHHDHNWTLRKNDYCIPKQPSREVIEKAYKAGRLFAIDKDELYEILKDFGIRKNLI